MTDAQGQGGHSASAATAKGVAVQNISEVKWTLQMPLKLKRIQIAGILSTLWQCQTYSQRWDCKMKALFFMLQ